MKLYTPFCPKPGRMTVKADSLYTEAEQLFLDSGAFIPLMTASFTLQTGGFSGSFAGKWGNFLFPAGEICGFR